MAHHELSRRDFLKASVGTAGAFGVGIFAFPQGLEIAQTITPGVTKVTRSYPPVRVAKLGNLIEGEPLDFQYPMYEKEKKLTFSAWALR